MKIDFSSLNSIKEIFLNLGYQDNSIYNFDPSLNDLNFEEIKNMHLISNTYDFKIWAIELEELRTDIMNKIAFKFYKTNPFEYNLLIFYNSSFNTITLLHYHREKKGKLKIRRLNIEDNRVTATDKEIIEELSIKNREIIDSWDIYEIHKRAFDIEKVTKSFFDEFRKQVEFLSNNIKGINNNENKKNYAVLIISRMIFLYFIQKKGWLNGKKDYLYDRFVYCEENKLNYYKDILEPLFFECLNTPLDVGMIKNRSERARKLYENFKSVTDIECNSKFRGIPYLNGGLFERNPKYEVGNDISISNEVFKELFENLLNKYNFTVREDLGYDTDIAVDPELLGRIFENMINVQERKKTGSFYTPRPIISFMCKQSLKEYLFNKVKVTDKEKIEHLINFLEDENLYGKIKVVIDEQKKISEEINGEKFKLTMEEAYELLGLLNKVKICDPAVGSGAFILGMLQLLVLIKYKINLYVFNKHIDFYETKKEIIKNNLFGVDIQEGAIDIARLRLWLSLAVEYEAKSIEDVKPLPNLAYKIVQGNSLISKFEDVDFDEKILNSENIDQVSMFPDFYDDIFSNLKQLIAKYFDATTDKKKLEERINNLEFQLIKKILKDNNKYNSEEDVIKVLEKNKEMYFSWCLNFPDVFINNDERGFDIVIGNPPYVNTKDVNKLEYKDSLQKVYGFRDDLYNHFTYRAFQLLKKNGILAFITSNTFFTIQTKQNMRQLLQEKHIIYLIDTPKAFEALVDTAIFIVRNAIKKSDYKMTFIDARKADINAFLNLKNAQGVNIYDVNIKIYRDNLMNVFFRPDGLNMQIYKKYIPIMKKLYTKWWDKISTSKDIVKNHSAVDEYRKKLKPGDITLLGLITEGGQGLATGNNGRFVGVLEGTKYAEKVKESRIEKFYDCIITDEKIKKKIIKYFPEIKNINSKLEVKDYLNSLGEKDIRNLFDKIKDVTDRDIFGQGYIYRIVSKDEIADVEKITDEEKLNGIEGEKTFVPYDKGDKEGNRWYLETPYYIDWSKNNVKFLLNNSGKKGKGMPVVRNKEYYFREGFCWSDVHTIYLKSRIKGKSINDVKSMSLYLSLNESKISTKYIVALINSKFISEFQEDFLNNTSSFQINDARKLPIIIPTKEQLDYVNIIVDRAIEIKKKQFSGEISQEEAEAILNEVQEKVDKFVYDLYGINPEMR